MQIITTMRYHLTSLGMDIIKMSKIANVEDDEKREALYTAGGIINWYSHYDKLYGSSSKN